MSSIIAEAHKAQLNILDEKLRIGIHFEALPPTQFDQRSVDGIWKSLRNLVCGDVFFVDVLPHRLAGALHAFLSRDDNLSHESRGLLPHLLPTERR